MQEKRNPKTLSQTLSPARGSPGDPGCPAATQAPQKCPTQPEPPQNLSAESQLMKIMKFGRK